MMRFILLLLTIMVSSLVLNGQKIHSQVLKKNYNQIQVHKHNGPSVVCYHDDKVIQEYVKKRSRSPKFLTKKKPASFNVSYDPVVRFPQEMIDAFELGTLPLIAELFNSDVPINIEVSSTDIPGALAAAAPGTSLRFINTSPCLDCWHPIALGEKLIGEPFNDPDDPDVLVFVNFDNEFWYFDYTDPEGAGTNFDFVTIMFHEMIHALGFASFSGLNDDQTGSLFADNSISIYDYYLENGNGDILRETFDENSLRLGTALSNNDLFWDAFKIGQIDERAKLYAPRDYAPGSSIRHVDEATYQSGPDALMSPTAQRGQVLRDGGIAIEMLYDMGWAMAKIDVLVDQDATEELDQDLNLRAQVISDIEYDQSSLAIHLSTDTFETEMVVPMDVTSEADIYNTIIAATGQPQNVQYYIEVTDSRGVTRTTPSPAPDFFFEYQFILDNEGPEILHDPIISLKEVDKVSTLELTADITDPLNVGSVFIEWRLNGSDAIELTEMMFNENSDDPFAENEYIGTIDFGRALTSADMLEYRISATDEAKGKNNSTFPTDGSFLSIPITPEIAPVTFYANDFNSESDDFEGNGFSVRQERNFASPAIHSNHPYLNAGEGNSFNLVYELKIPILIEEERPVIEFEEVVLVEPGDPGTVFGQDEFWDYVIVEGKKRGSQDWLPFLDGYDSQANATWESAYNSTINGQNSLGTGRSNQYRTRKINMVENGNFAFGDTVAVRFRLFSDPFAYGWGWAIDDLAIQDLNSAVEDFVEEQNFDIIPNPASDEALVSLNLENSADDMRITVVDITGRIVQDRVLTNKSLRVRERLSIDNLESGVYLVNVIFNSTDVITKKLIKQ